MERHFLGPSESFGAAWCNQCCLNCFNQDIPKNLVLRSKSTSWVCFAEQLVKFIGLEVPVSSRLHDGSSDMLSLVALLIGATRLC